jgi:ADP-ribose pyrophosphatase YjhB (NUDIX family)
MKREYPQNPIIAVGGVIFHGQTVLLVKRDREPARGQWSLPGGVVELGETLKEALMREIMEEVSIKIKIEGLVRIMDRIESDHEDRIRFHYVIVDYWGWKVSGEPRAASDISDARFVSLEQAQEMGVHSDVEETIRMALELREVQMDADAR